LHQYKYPQLSTGAPELLLGEHPFPWIIRAIYSKEGAEKFLREGVGEIPDNLPGSLRGMIERCLSPDSANRFPDISALIEILLEAYGTEFGREYCFPEVEIDDSPEWWFNRGVAFCNIGLYAGAEISYKEALRRFKRIPGTEIYQARCLMNRGIVAYESTGKFFEAEEN
jgi:tetratricopeptide (TPR) repeat protein